MEETLKMMKTIIEGYEKDTNLQELLRIYKLSQKSNILAYLFVSNYGLILQTSKLYKLLDEQDIASYTLQELDKCILNYDFSKECSFVTFFMACLKNRLRTENESQHSNLRFANFNTVDIDDCYEIESTLDYDEEFYLSQYNLTAKEEHQCKLFLAGHTVKEVAEKLKLSTTSIYERNKKIRKKLLESI